MDSRQFRLRAPSFGGLIFVGHEEIKFRNKAYLALVITDGASYLLWATALTSLEGPETLEAFRQWMEGNRCVPNDKFRGITPYPCGPRNPWPNRAETAVRLFTRAWSVMVNVNWRMKVMQRR